MMSVNKYIVNFSKAKPFNGEQFTGATINLPLGTNFQLVDQDEIVQTKFVDAEINKAINVILDYDRIKFKPALINNQSVTIIDNITYNVHFLNSNNQFNPYSYFGDIGFDNFDVKFRKKAFTKSFLRLSFYDTDVPTNQRLISFITLFPKINQTDYSTGGSSPWGTITPVNNLKIQFNLGNNLVDRALTGEGFFLYHFKDEVTPDLPKELYMRAEFNNAKNGKTTGLMSTSSTTNTIDNLVVTTQGSSSTNNLFMKYILNNINDQYFYEIDTTYSTNVQVISNDYVVDLYQIFAL
jgi:hypothetical protein